MLARLEEIGESSMTSACAWPFETGQESAPVLLDVPAQVESDVGINFDPENMILYGTGNPVARAVGVARGADYSGDGTVPTPYRPASGTGASCSRHGTALASYPVPGSALSQAS